MKQTTVKLKFLQFFSKNVLTFAKKSAIIFKSVDIAELCKGSTNDSDSFCSGSNPDSAAIKNVVFNNILFFAKTAHFCLFFH